MSLVLATTQENLGIAFVVALIVGWAIFLLVQIRKSGEAPGDEANTAPNRRPYLDDEALEGPRLEGAQKAAIAMLLVVVFGMPIYWLREPSRQEGAVKGFDTRSAQRGFILFQPADSTVPEGNVGHFGCGGCHGVDGEGGVANYTMQNSDGTSRVVKWVAPPLNSVLQRFSVDEVNRIITYGRPNTPMPPWGVAGGGPMNEQQVSDLVTYISSIQLTKKEFQEQFLKNLQEKGLDPADGAVLFDQLCSRCHTKGWSYGEPDVVGGGAFGPNLTAGDTLRQFPKLQDHIDFVTLGSDAEKPYGVRGVGTGRMPGFGGMLTEAQIKAIVDFERSL